MVAPLATYLGVVRRLSGRIKTSDAAQLWEESRSIREQLQQRNEYLQTVIDRHAQRIDRLEETVESLGQRNGELENENRALKKLVEAHEHTITRLEEENRVLKTRVAELEAAA